MRTPCPKVIHRHIFEIEGPEVGPIHPEPSDPRLSHRPAPEKDLSMSSIAVDQVLEAFVRHGDRHYGERVSQTAHALQCAELAARDGAGEALVAASLLHDYGHLLEVERLLDPDNPSTDEMHEMLGADAMAAIFGPEVVQPIALHVAAKRYLCATEPGYLEGLSAASVHSLTLQGGPFDPVQVRQFEAMPFAADAVRLRRYDDQGKIEGGETTQLADYRALLHRLALAQEG